MTFRPFQKGSISGRVYLTALLAIVSVCCLALASFYFAKETESEARRLGAQGFTRLISSTQLELLLEQHRRIVESMPAEVDRFRLARARTQLNEIGRKLNALTDELLLEKSDASMDETEKHISNAFPALFRLGDSVAFYAYNFAQDKALEFAEDYASTARATEQHIRRYRERRLSEAQDSMSRLTAAAKSLVLWVGIFTLLAFTLIGPIGLRGMHKMLSRLSIVTDAMVKVANNEPSAIVPALGDSDEVGKMARAVEVFRTNSQQLATREVQLAEVNHRFEIALNNMSHGLCMFDENQRLILCNCAYAELYSLPPILTQAGIPLNHLHDFRARNGTAPLVSAVDPVGDDILPESCVFTNELADGRVIAIFRQQMPDGGWVAIHEDITQRRRAEAEIVYLARHDVLTNLPNRALFQAHLDEAFASAQPFAVLCLDLDRFKQVNDTLGHAIGDELLKAISGRLTANVKAQDMVARVGGDEFAIVQRAVLQPGQCSALATRLIDALGKPYIIAGKRIVIGTSIGIALAPADASDSEQLLKNADMALYLAKKEGRGIHRFFEPELSRQVQARHALELALRSALTNGELDIHYQPIVELERLKIIGFEALLRWKHPERGNVPPLEFIPLAEETGLILPIGEWVLRTACQHAAQWPEPMNVAINLSPAQFKGQDLVGIVVNALAAAGLPSSRLELEITESVLLQNEPSTLGTLHQLRAIGVRISMDDFGTGYSSLAYLRSYPFDKIKIDRSFVRDMPEREDCKAIVHAVAELARSLKIKTVVEGVETHAQLEMARAEGCTEGQGYLFGTPVSRDAIAKYFGKTLRLVTAA